MTHTSSQPPTTAPTGPVWTITQLARQVGLTPDTLRYYERIDLLPAPARTSGSHRRYGPDALDRLHFIQGSQRLGLKLDEIRDLLAVRDTGACPCEPAAGLLRRHIAEVDAEMTRLAKLRAELVAMADALPAEDCPDPAPGTWRPAEPATDLTFCERT
ncbi:MULTISPECIES: heavy metal-responsive transcriptional regulator [unclassified Streptomyces]|uniref:heavy metal-responsive transcriptional regulator n=1 Tax=unclassified Streptomyces TaxID=2593676 RepID=UPI0033AFE057